MKVELKHRKRQLRLIKQQTQLNHATPCLKLVCIVLILLADHTSTCAAEYLGQSKARKGIRSFLEADRKRQVEEWYLEMPVEMAFTLLESAERNVQRVVKAATKFFAE